MKTTDEEFTQTIRRILPHTTLKDVEELKVNEAARERLKLEQGTLFFKIAAAMYRLDPAGVAHDLNDEHEYEGEISDLIPRLPECETAEDCSRVIHEICAKWFNGRVRTVEHYQEIGAAIFEIWQEQRADSELTLGAAKLQ